MFRFASLSALAILSAAAFAAVPAYADQWRAQVVISRPAPVVVTPAAYCPAPVVIAPPAPIYYAPAPPVGPLYLAPPPPVGTMGLPAPTYVPAPAYIPAPPRPWWDRFAFWHRDHDDHDRFDRGHDRPDRGHFDRR